MNGITIAAPLMGTSLFRKYMMSKYTQSIRRAGGDICWINIEDPQKAAAEAIECDGLLLPGGADIAPEMYGQTRTEQCGKPNAARDAAEPLMLKAFIETGKPILCICRGIQMLNTVFGGTLKQDIKDEQKYKHMDFLSRATSTHPVQVEKNSLLGKIIGEGEISVNSMHHQVIDRLGDSLTVSARSPEGYIEAVEMSGYGFLIAVQWHPEHMSKKSETQRKLFSAFISACAENRKIHKT